MAAERQLAAQKKIASEKFRTAIEEHGAEFLPKLTEQYFLYLMASWGLPFNERRLLVSIFISKLKKDIEKFCSKHCVYDSSQYASLSDTLLNEEYQLDADISVRRLFIQYARSHQGIPAGLLYDFPHEEHQHILASELASPGKNHFSHKIKEDILSASKVIKKEFIQATEDYAQYNKYARKLTRLTIITALMFIIWVAFIGELILVPLYDFSNRLGLNPGRKFFLDIFIQIALMGAFAGVAKKLSDYTETQRWKNFSKLDELPDEFKNFLLEKSKELKEKLLFVEEEKPQPSQSVPQKVFHEISSSSARATPLALPSIFYKKPKKPSHKPSNKDLALTTLPPSDSKKKSQVKSDPIVWEYASLRIMHDPSLRRNVIKLWNNSMTTLTDYIHWDSAIIKIAFNNHVLYALFAKKAWDGHRTRAVNGTGWVKQGEVYKIKLFNDTTSHNRAEFVEVAKREDPKTKEVSHLYGFHRITND